MSVPQRADKWIVFVSMFGLVVVQLLRSTVPGGFGAIAWVAIPVVISAVSTACFVVWCTTCRVLALRIAPNSRNIRIYANASFFVVLLTLILVPYESTMTVQLPAKVLEPAPVVARPDARSNR